MSVKHDEQVSFEIEVSADLTIESGLETEECHGFPVQRPWSEIISATIEIDGIDITPTQNAEKDAEKLFKLYDALAKRAEEENA